MELKSKPRYMFLKRNHLETRVNCGFKHIVFVGHKSSSNKFGLEVDRCVCVCIACAIQQMCKNYNIIVSLHFGKHKEHLDRVSLSLWRACNFSIFFILLAWRGCCIVFPSLTRGCKQLLSLFFS